MSPIASPGHIANVRLCQGLSDACRDWVSGTGSAGGWEPSTASKGVIGQELKTVLAIGPNHR